MTTTFTSFPKGSHAETMRAEQQPDLYGGDGCDEIVSRWFTYGEGDKDGDVTTDPLVLIPRRFPPGTVVVVREPRCPKCGEGRAQTFNASGLPADFASICSCGFDWAAWTINLYG